MSGSAGGMPWRTRGQKLQLVAISAATVGALYGAGHLLVNSPMLNAPASSSQQDLIPPASPGNYRDGTFTGTAQNEFGGVSVEVTITSGRIASVRITGCNTFFPQTYIDGLPAKVVTAQTADVAAVSGATGSWQDFVQAVQQALRQAASSR
ncbi:MAG TPA: FMN-binding protein [Pseudonocardiaceae bacterium]|nr:FMN-binding protein [Pseudonocardiaceae bacterium]